MLHAEMLLRRTHLFLFYPQGLILPSPLTQASPWCNSHQVYLVWLCPQSDNFQTSPPGLPQTGSEKVSILNSPFLCAIRGAVPKASFTHIFHMTLNPSICLRLLLNYKPHPINEYSSPMSPYLSQYPTSPILKASLHLPPPSFTSILCGPIFLPHTTNPSDRTEPLSFATEDTPHYPPRSPSILQFWPCPHILSQT